MSSNLSPRCEAFIQEKLAQGVFPTREKVIEAAIDALEDSEINVPLIDGEHLEAVEHALEQLAAGLVVPWNSPEEWRLFEQRSAARKSERLS